MNSNNDCNDSDSQNTRKLRNRSYTYDPIKKPPPRPKQSVTCHKNQSRIGAVGSPLPSTSAKVASPKPQRGRPRQTRTSTQNSQTNQSTMSQPPRMNFDPAFLQQAGIDADTAQNLNTYLHCNSRF